MHEQQIFLPVVEEAEITLGIVLGPYKVLQGFLGAHGNSSTAAQRVACAHGSSRPGVERSKVAARRQRQS
jgi:hypothetical protein